MQRPALMKPLLVAVTATSAVLPASGVLAQSHQDKLKSMAQLYGVAAYVLSANERYDLIDAGVNIEPSPTPVFCCILYLKDEMPPQISSCHLDECGR